MKAAMCTPVAYWNHLVSFPGLAVTGSSPSPIQPESLGAGSGVGISQSLCRQGNNPRLDD